MGEKGKFLSSLRLAEKNIESYKKSFKSSIESVREVSEHRERAMFSELEKQKKRRADLLGLFLDKILDKDEFLKEKILLENKIEELQAKISEENGENFLSKLEVFEIFLELLGNGFFSWKNCTDDKRRFLVDFWCSNFFITQKNLLVVQVLEFLEWENLEKNKMVAEIGIEPMIFGL